MWLADVRTSKDCPHIMLTWRVVCGCDWFTTPVEIGMEGLAKNFHAGKASCDFCQDRRDMEPSN